jgi:uncharacterized protein (DUF433 family)
MSQINCDNLSEHIPLRTDVNGTIRVGNTRVTLSAVISCFDRGETSEAIVDNFNTLQLDDVYCVLGYFLRHEDEVRAYLKQEQEEGEVLRQSIEAKLPSSPLREHLLKRKHAS